METYGREQISKTNPLLMDARDTTIDDLPEDILLHMLSFLPITTAIKASAVAPNWRNLWHFMPVLRFCILEFQSSFPDKSALDVRRLFVDLTSKTLLLRPRHSPLQKFSVIFHYRNHFRAYVDSWVRYAINSKVVELELGFDVLLPTPHNHDERKDEDIRMNTSYVFHFSDLINSSVKVLKLRQCDLLFPVKIESLRELHLVEFFLDNEQAENLISACVNLEVLSMEDIWGLSTLKIVSQKLKKLKVGPYKVYKPEHHSVEICAPCLESINFTSFYAGKYISTDMPSLIEGHVDFGSRSWWDFACWTNIVSLLSGVERLTVQNMWIWSGDEEYIRCNDEELNRKSEVQSDVESEESQIDHHGKLSIEEAVLSETFAFNNLKHSVLLTGYTQGDLLGIEALLYACPRLESMVLVYSYETDRDEILGEEITKKPIVLRMPRLRLVKMKKYKGVKNEVYVVGLLKKYGVALQKIVAFPANVGGTLSSPISL